MVDGPHESARRGAKLILHALREQAAQEAFASFCATTEAATDLGPGCWLLAQTRYPELDPVAYQARLDEMAQELRERLTGSETPRAAIEVINRHLFQTLGFRGNKRDYYDPDNSYLNRVLDRRLGIPISLAIVYLLLGWKLKLPLTGINLPGHFIVQWHSKLGQFYIDPFNEGRLVTAQQCREYCEQAGWKFTAKSLAEASTRQVLARTCQNLQAIYSENDPPRAQQFGRYLALLAAR